MMAEYRFDDIVHPKRILAADFACGFVLWNFLEISYTLRTDFSTVGNKFSLGYIYRFR